MEFVTGKHIGRRTFLKGVGASVGLPYLDAMIPAGRMSSAVARVAEEKTPLIAIEEVHGLAGCNEWGASQFLYAPEIIGKDFELSDVNALSPLREYQDYLTIVSNSDCRMAEAFTTPEIGGDHFRSSAVFLTQSHPKQTQGSDLFVGTSLDQMHARRFGQDTPLPSMQFTIPSIDQAGGCTYNYSCAYTDSISWASPNEPLPMIRDPRVAFDMLFGAGGTPAERTARRKSRASILDWITGEVAQIRSELGSEDRQRMEQYLNNVREIERRIQRVEAHNSTGEARSIPEAPAGVPDSYTEHMHLMFDLQVLAFMADATRVFSLKMARDASPRVYAESGTDAPYHAASHHGGREERVRDFAKINTYHVSMIPYFLDKLAAVTEGDGTLLDKTMVMYGSAMADSNLHNHIRCPLFMVGGANGMLQGENHVRATPGTPMANVMLSLLHKLGVDKQESFGNSTGVFSI